MKTRIAGRKVVYSGYVTVSKNNILTGDREIEREIVDQADAAAILPFDPERKVATLVRLLRAPVLLRGLQEELLEAPAGVIDPGEGAAEAARRELLEETGLTPNRVEHVATVWSTPGVSTERVALYLATYSPDSRNGEGGGLDGENENITVVELPLATLADSRRILDMKTLTLVLAMRLRRPELFGAEAGTSNSTEG
ncbi:NUDIX domain-containing protein [Nitratireductor thuwali]|uniref:GDP-mannose pyrophosphatase n=1 Tax=Nitratireductor thuwali TaxID=2267699 RepID=A0ABY5MQC1_9HYPH|nr:GDP-mannose pyrophosphatase NudK [Nitratireductor thuwali]